LAPSTIHEQRRREILDSSLDELVGSTPSFRYAFTLGTEEFTSQSKLKFEGRDVISIVWIAPWAAVVSLIAQYLEADCNFHGCRSYVFYTSMTIEANESFPFGLSISPTESKEMYTNFDSGMAHLGADLAPPAMIGSWMGTPRIWEAPFSSFSVLSTHY
jgi:hypothetical protein